MPAASRGRTIAAIAVSAAVHVPILVALALHAPFLAVSEEPAGPPEPIIPVLLMPRSLPPTTAAGARPGPIRLHRRQLRFLPPELPVAPLPAPEAATPPPRAAPGPAATKPAVLQDAVKPPVQTALRRSAIGCANPQAAGLTRAEREACEEQLGSGSQTALFPGLGLAAGKQATLDKAGARREADRRYREAPPPPGIGASGEPWQVAPDPHK